MNAKLASLIQEKQRVATVSQPTSSRDMPEFGMEEIGIDMGGGPVTVPADDRPVPMPTFADTPEDEVELGAPDADSLLDMVQILAKRDRTRTVPAINSNYKASNGSTLPTVNRLEY